VTRDYLGPRPSVVAGTPTISSIPDSLSFIHGGLVPRSEDADTSTASQFSVVALSTASSSTLGSLTRSEDRSTLPLYAL
jgi:hypothetical protein